MTYTGPLSQPILSAIKALAASKRIPATVTMTYEPGAEVLAIDVHWAELGETMVIHETDEILTMTDDDMQKQVYRRVRRMLDRRTDERFKKRRR